MTELLRKTHDRIISPEPRAGEPTGPPTPATCAYLEGLDAGNDGRLLTGFREWLVTRLGAGNNLAWRGLVIHLARPDGPASGREAVESANHDPAVIDTLFALLDEFFTLRATPQDLVRIYDEYLTWLKAQPWHTPA